MLSVNSTDRPGDHPRPPQGGGRARRHHRDGGRDGARLRRPGQRRTARREDHRLAHLRRRSCQPAVCLRHNEAVRHARHLLHELGIHRRPTVSSPSTRRRPSRPTATRSGRHTISHPDLATISADEASRQICNDRVNWAAWGIPTTNFAYPFASSTTAVETLVKNCGDNSARGLGDIKTRFSLPDLRWRRAMPVPAAELYYTKAPDQVETTWTLADLKIRSPRQRRPAAGCN